MPRGKKKSKKTSSSSSSSSSSSFAQTKSNKKVSPVVIDHPALMLSTLNELISVNKIELPRISVKGVILGCVSAGKSTLVNAILVNKLSDTKMKRTTMLPQVYLEGSTADDMSYNVADILKQNTKMNEDIISGKIRLTTENCTPVYHTIPPLYDIIEFPSNEIHLDMYDIPGLNDSTTETMYYNYIDKSFSEFDIIFVVVDIQEAFNTSASIKILDNIIKNAQKNTEKTVNVCIIANKCDDLRENEASGILEFDDEEYTEMFEQIQNEVSTRLVIIPNIEYNILKMSAEDSFIYRMYLKNPDVELDPKLINKFGLNEFGKHKWSKWSADKKNKKIKEFLADTEVGDRFKMCGFAGFQTYLMNTIDYKRQYEIISSNIKLAVEKIPQYSDKYPEHISDEYIKYGALSAKMFHLYSPKCMLGSHDMLSRFVNDKLQTNLNTQFASLDMKITDDTVFDSLNQIKDSIMKTTNKFITILHGLFKTQLNAQYKTIEATQNEWLASSFQLPATYGTIDGIIEKLTLLHQNGYTDFEVLISNVINLTIQTSPHLICGDTNHKHSLIKYSEYIQTIGYSAEDCFEFIKKCYLFRISTDVCLYHAGLLDLALNTLSYGTINAAFEDYLYNMKVLNLFFFKQMSFTFNPATFATPDEKANIMSLFKFLIKLYHVINGNETDDIQQGIKLSDFDISDKDNVAEQFSDSSSSSSESEEEDS